VYHAGVSRARRWLALGLCVFALAVIRARPASAYVIIDELRDVPVPRLLRNSEREAGARPNAPNLAVVARLHTFAAAAGGQPQQQGAHLAAAVRAYQAAIAVDPRALYQHGLAYALGEAARIGVPELGTPDELRARAARARAAAVAGARAEPASTQPFPSLAEQIALEAAAAEGENGKADKTKQKKPPKRRKPPKQPPRPDWDTSPVIFGDARAVEDLVDPDPRHAVRFDLGGDRRERRWPWLRPSTSILVWDPAHAGRIGSARQLFGSVTWWLFWPDGYRALAALDDDGDGALTGAELDGLGVWRDANGNGVSDAGEVEPAREAIARIAVRPDGAGAGVSLGRVLGNARGVVTRDGRVLPSFDWLVAPLPETSAARRAARAPAKPQQQQGSGAGDRKTDRDRRARRETAAAAAVHIAAGEVDR
jgi:hypothetical protein